MENQANKTERRLRERKKENIFRIGRPLTTSIRQEPLKS